MTTSENSFLPVVFIVDDEPLVLKAIQQTVASIPCKTCCFQNPLECLGALKRETCHLLITDVSMPQMNGIQLLKRAHQLQPLMPVLVVTGYGDIPTAVDAVKAGALEFIEKPLDEDIFLPIVRTVLTQLPRVNQLTGQALTESELKVLQQVVAGYSNKQIAHNLSRSIRTIENHRHRLMKKMNVTSLAELVKVALELGLTTLPPH